MSEPIDMVRFVRELPARPRGKAAIVLTHTYVEQAAWAAQLASRTGSEHLDLLAHFAQEAALARRIGHYSVETLFEFLPGRGSAPVLIVSGLEFLAASWAGQSGAMEQFAGRVESWTRTPCLLFVMQHDKTIATHRFQRYRQYAFVVDQNDTLKL